MAPKIVWSERALSDLREMFDYIRRDSEIHAALMVERILASAGQLGDFPLSGRIVPEFDRKEIREIILSSYRLVYRIKRGSIQILRISHSARLLRTS